MNIYAHAEKPSACLTLLALKANSLNSFMFIIEGKPLAACKKKKLVTSLVFKQRKVTSVTKFTKIQLFKLCNSVSNLLKAKCQLNFHSYLHKSKCKSYIHTGIIPSLFAFLFPLTDKQQLLLF